MPESTKTVTRQQEDEVLLDWLEEQVVNVIYLDDGRLIDVRGNSVREALKKAIQEAR